MEKAHKFDVLRENDSFQAGEKGAVVIRREVVEKIPDEVPNWMRDEVDDPPYVVLEVEKGGEVGVGLATPIVKNLHVDHNEMSGFGVVAGKYDDDSTGEIVIVGPGDRSEVELDQATAEDLAAGLLERNSEAEMDLPVALVDLFVDTPEDFADALLQGVQLARIYDRIADDE